MSKSTTKEGGKKKVIRCAIYTRKSTEEGLQQEFNTLDAQRQSAEMYIAAQKHEGWVCLPDRYDDGGFTGGNMDRPAVKRLMEDIEAGRIDCVVVYKVDRLSRSLTDFARIMDVFDRHEIAFVSVTQQFNTSTSMGRLMLNVLLSFAQFEREIISERTRDKLAAARRKGKFVGGRPVLGYDIVSSPTGSKLQVNDAEAVQVRSIFEMYLKHQALMPTVRELQRRGWTTKLWMTKAGRGIGGRPFDKHILYQMLTNVIYTGKVTYMGETYEGEHSAIVDEQVWRRVQALLSRNGRTGGAGVRNKYGATLKDILYCGSCNCKMCHAYTSRANRRYRYYVCLKAQKRGWHTCQTKSVPAGEIEQFVVQQIKSMGKDSDLLARILNKAKDLGASSLADLQAEERRLGKELFQHNAELKMLTADMASCWDMDALANLHERIQRAERRTTEVREQIVALSRQMVDQREVDAALSAFDPVWESLGPREQARIIKLLVERIDYRKTSDGGLISITFRPNGIKTLAEQNEEIAA